MYAKQHQISLEFEMLRWLVVIALAGVLALAVASSAWGNDVRNTSPGPLPAEATRIAKPMPLGADLLTNPRQSADLQEVRQLWTALAFHRGGDPSSARAAWDGLQLHPRTETWQYVALGVTYLQEGDCEAATAAFQVAQGLQPDNPVPAYYLGLVRLTQAQRAEHWHDGRLPRNVQFASLGGDGLLDTPDVVPNSKAMYEWVAMAELTRAIELAPHLDLDQPLIATDPLATGWQEASPLVSDLLDALGADNVAGRAHHVLGSLQVARGALAAAERNLDAAAATGLTIVHGYADLAAAFEADGDHADAVRAYMKAVANGDRSHETTRGVLENFGKALFDAR